MKKTLEDADKEYINLDESHKVTINKFSIIAREFCKANSPSNQYGKLRAIANLNKIKSLRVKADYRDSYVTKREYDENVVTHYRILNDLMEEIIKKG